MIIVLSVGVLAVFLLFGWAITTETLQQRVWRRRVAEGDANLVGALIDEAMSTWRRRRPPPGVPTHEWAGVQAAQLVAVTMRSATLSSSAEPTFRTEGIQRVQQTTALEEAIALAARLVEMLLYDVPSLELESARVDIYATFHHPDGRPHQRPILTTTATRAQADPLAWERDTAADALARFETRFTRLEDGEGAPIELPPIEDERLSVAAG